MSGTWYSGTVKEVVDGATIVVMGNVASGPPPEKRIILSSLVAPRMARRDGQDEPFAWPAREFLRKQAIGQACTFKCDYVLPSAPGLEFGSVFINGKENLALIVATAGWAKVRSGGGQQSPYIDALISASGLAESQALGVFTKDPAAHTAAIRKPPPADGFDAAALLAAAGKGKPLPAIVERVQNGSTVQVTLLADQQPATVMICGVQAPSMGRRPPPVEGASIVAASPDPVPDPYAREAKHFTEVRVLNREVRVVLEGIDKHNNLLGSLVYPETGSTEDNQLLDLGVQLVSRGLAKTVEWGLNMMINGAFTLREAERTAKKERHNMWHDYTPPVGSSTKQAGKFTGTVVEVASGDVLVVQDAASKAERRITISSIRAPRAGRRDEKAEPYGYEAKEFLRSRLIGKEVMCCMEYERKVGGPLAEGAGRGGEVQPERIMSFGTVTISTSDPKTGTSRDSNIAEMLLVRGLASVVRHRSDEERSAFYEQLMAAEESGKKNKKGLHSAKEAPVHHVNDVSLPGTANRAKQYLPFFERAGQVTGICEHVLSGHRVKVHIPKEGVTIAFAPSGVRAPQRGQAASRDGRPATLEEPFWQESSQFTRELALQREVEIDVETVDRGGTFLGSLRVLGGARPIDLGMALLERGLAKLHPSFDPERDSNGIALVAAESAAKDRKIKVWEKYVAPAKEEGTEEDSSAGGEQGREKMEVLLTHVLDGGSFWVQKSNEPRVAWLEEQMQAVAACEAGPRPVGLVAGSMCLGQFSGDQAWYRARVEAADSRDPVNPQYSVAFIDYGNKETLPASRVRAIQPQLEAVPPQAMLCTLAYLKVPGLESEAGEDAARFLNSAAAGKHLVAIVERRERGIPRSKDRAAQPPRLHVLLSELGARPGGAETANAALLEQGLAQVQRPPKHQMAECEEVLAALDEAEAIAKRAHRGIFEFGDPADDDDEEEKPRGKAWGR